MTIFKTILWTSLFWIIVIVGLWVSSLFFPYEATIVIPAKVKSVIIADAKIEAIDNHEVVKVEEEIIPVETVQETGTTEEIIEEESTVEEVVSPVEEQPVAEEIIAEPTKNSIFPQPTQAISTTESTTDDRIAELENRLNEVEWKYEWLIEELRTIFWTPLFTQLLSQAFAENPTVETTNLQ